MTLKQMLNDLIESLDDLSCDFDCMDPREIQKDLEDLTEQAINIKKRIYAD